MGLLFENGDFFATGAVRYDYHPVTPSETTNRIMLPVVVAGIPIDAVVDTGAPYVILAPRIARLAGLSSTFALGRETMLIRGMRLDGNTYRFNMRLVADVGDNLDVDLTFPAKSV